MTRMRSGGGAGGLNGAAATAAPEVAHERLDGGRDSGFWEAGILKDEGAEHLRVQLP
jgi:hypothetical protein